MNNNRKALLKITEQNDPESYTNKVGFCQVQIRSGRYYKVWFYILQDDKTKEYVIDRRDGILKNI